jgi:hypothetical protein
MTRSRYQIRVTGKPRANPDPVMLAQVVMLIGRRLHQEQQQRQQVNNGGRTQNSPDIDAVPEQQPAPLDQEADSVLHNSPGEPES